MNRQMLAKQSNIKITVKTDANLKDKKLGVYYVSPDLEGIMEIDYERHKDSISFTLPELHYYGVVSIGEKDKFKANMVS
ncbi:MAG: hypothetical protein ACOZCL_14915 [Bacillota bacterium]